MIKIISILIYGALALLIFSSQEDYFSSLPSPIPVLIGVGVGIFCAVLAVATDLVFFLIRGK